MSFFLGVLEFAAGLSASLSCWLRGHRPGRPILRGLLLTFVRCERCACVLMSHRDFPGTWLPLDDENYRVARDFVRRCAREFPELEHADVSRGGVE